MIDKEKESNFEAKKKEAREFAIKVFTETLICKGYDVKITKASVIVSNGKEEKVIKKSFFNYGVK